MAICRCELLVFFGGFLGNHHKPSLCSWRAPITEEFFQAGSRHRQEQGQLQGNFLNSLPNREILPKIGKFPYFGRELNRKFREHLVNSLSLISLVPLSAPNEKAIRELAGRFCWRAILFRWSLFADGLSHTMLRPEIHRSRYSQFLHSEVQGCALDC
jgi:hypothetical protein